MSSEKILKILLTISIIVYLTVVLAILFLMNCYMIKKLIFQNFRVFGCKVFFYVPKQFRKKCLSIFLGYDFNFYAYRIYDVYNNKNYSFSFSCCFLKIFLVIVLHLNLLLNLNNFTIMKSREMIYLIMKMIYLIMTSKILTISTITIIFQIIMSMILIMIF